MSKISRLEEIANEQRKLLTIKNTFNGDSDANQYSSTNTHAMSDEETPEHGKGTGIYLDVNGGGNASDKRTRKDNLRHNEFKAGDEYQKPDTSSLGDIIY